VFFFFLVGFGGLVCGGKAFWALRHRAALWVFLSHGVHR